MTMTDTTGNPPIAETPDPVVVEITPPAARGRGRPRKDAAAAPVSPSEASAAKSTPKASRGKKGVKFEKDDLSQLSKQIQGLHELMSLASGIPELRLETQEAEMLGSAVANVCEEYDLSLSGKTGALLQLLAAGAMIYVPRLGRVSARVKHQAAAAKAAKLAIVGGTDTDNAPTADA
jgi:hypothetical protein